MILKRLRLRRFLTIGAVATLVGWAVTDSPRAFCQLIQGGIGSFGGTGTYYSGQATVINMTDAHNYPGPIVICDTGPLPTSGGFQDASVTEHFETAASVSGPETQAYLAYRDGRAVAGAILYMAHGVGGIGWVATLPAEFGRGYGRAVTRAVIEDGFARGARFMNLQASPMGEPMYRRMGFTTPTHYRWFLASP